MRLGYLKKGPILRTEEKLKYNGISKPNGMFGEHFHFCEGTSIGRIDDGDFVYNYFKKLHC